MLSNTGQIKFPWKYLFFPFFFCKKTIGVSNINFVHLFQNNDSQIIKITITIIFASTDKGIKLKVSKIVDITHLLKHETGLSFILVVTE